jgi:5-methylcytosine-specific restriction protein B
MILMSLSEDAVKTSIEEIINYAKTVMNDFGAKDEDYVFRNNTVNQSLEQGDAYFGFISSGEDLKGPYHDFSLVIFPSKEDKPWLISLGVGKLGFKNDYDLASAPGVKRLFSSVISQEGFCKSSFLDIETDLPKQFKKTFSHLPKALKDYSKLLVASDIISDPLSEEGKNIIRKFIAAYARLREYPTNEKQKSSLEKTLEASGKATIDEEKEVLELLEKRKFVVLQGAPGTGKTRLAKIIAKKLTEKPFFTQFHAETSYSDFIFGIKPKLKDREVGYKAQEGIFYKSLKAASDNPKEKVVLIIDEINRANLSNVLGAIFYLFEYQLDDDKHDNSVEIEIGDEFSISRIPLNYYVICTMNTADRSLAVVDFALRRRFAWYTLKPHAISPPKNKNFFGKDFLRFNSIFNWYASSEELSLQPGQAYFIADSEETMEDRVKYELLPLIREYLAEGLLVNAKDEFAKYFYDRIGEVLFE